MPLEIKVSEIRNKVNKELSNVISRQGIDEAFRSHQILRGPGVQGITTKLTLRQAWDAGFFGAEGESKEDLGVGYYSDFVRVEAFASGHGLDLFSLMNKCVACAIYHWVAGYISLEYGRQLNEQDPENKNLEKADSLKLIGDIAREYLDTWVVGVLKPLADKGETLLDQDLEPSPAFIKQIASHREQTARRNPTFFGGVFGVLSTIKESFSRFVAWVLEQRSTTEEATREARPTGSERSASSGSVTNASSPTKPSPGDIRKRLVELLIESAGDPEKINKGCKGTGVFSKGLISLTYAEVINAGIFDQHGEYVQEEVDKNRYRSKFNERVQGPLEQLGLSSSFLSSVPDKHKYAVVGFYHGAHAELSDQYLDEYKESDRDGYVMSEIQKEIVKQLKAVITEVFEPLASDPNAEPPLFDADLKPSQALVERLIACRERPLDEVSPDPDFVHFSREVEAVEAPAVREVEEPATVAGSTSPEPAVSNASSSFFATPPAAKLSPQRRVEIASEVRMDAEIFGALARVNYRP